MRGDSLESMLNDYRDELTQLTYTPEYAAQVRLRKMTAIIKTTKKQMDDAALLRKLEGFTEPDEEAPKK